MHHVRFVFPLNAALAIDARRFLPKIMEWVQAHGGEPVIPFSGAFETKVAEMPADEADKFCKEAGVPSMLVSKGALVPAAALSTLLLLNDFFAQRCCQLTYGARCTPYSTPPTTTWQPITPGLTDPAQAHPPRILHLASPAFYMTDDYLTP